MGTDFTAVIDAETAEGDPLPVTFTGRVILRLSDGTYSILKGDRIGATGSLSIEEGELVFAETPAPEGAFNCYVDGERTLTEGTGTYEYEYDGSTLALTAKEELCPTRKVILERAWTPVP